MSHCSLPVTPCPSTMQAETCQYRGPAPTRGAGSVTQKGLGKAVGNHRGCVLVLKSLTVLGQLAQEEPQPGSLSFKGRTQCKPRSSSDVAGSAGAFNVVPSY